MEFILSHAEKTSFVLFVPLITSTLAKLQELNQNTEGVYWVDLKRVMDKDLEKYQ
jgi:hypothetical protein